MEDRFEIEREIGAGGMGRVFRARDRVSGEAVAIKVLSGASPSELRRFEREAITLQKLDHPGICGIHVGGTDKHFCSQGLQGIYFFF